jgi:ABC-type antimicrobial peptide transport system permease subunit
LADFNFNVTHSNVNYASFTFFLNNIKDTYLNHPVFYLDSLLKNYLPEKLKEGEVYILGSEIMDADVRYRANQVFGIYKSNDTIVRGNITNGKMTGVWQYNFFNDIIGSRINFYYDREKKGIASFPENGIWEYHYPNGNVAIEGNFLHGKKEGIWKFYDLSGKLASIKEYKKDEPHGLFIDYKLFENDFERRRYYLNKFEYKTILYNSRSPKQADIFTIYSNDVYQKQYYISGNDNNLECSKNGDIFKTIPNNSKKFRRLVYRHYVKYLYPERKK